MLSQSKYKLSIIELLSVTIKFVQEEGGLIYLFYLIFNCAMWMNEQVRSVRRPSIRWLMFCFGNLFF